MPFVKGQSGYPAGKPKGAVSQKARFVNELFNVWKDNKEKAQKNFAQMFNDTKDFKWLVEVLVSLCPKEVEHSGTITDRKIIIEVAKKIEDNATPRLSGKVLQEQ